MVHDICAALILFIKGETTLKNEKVKIKERKFRRFSEEIKVTFPKGSKQKTHVVNKSIVWMIL